MQPMTDATAKLTEAITAAIEARRNTGNNEVRKLIDECLDHLTNARESLRVANMVKEAHYYDELPPWKEN